MLTGEAEQRLECGHGRTAPVEPEDELVEVVGQGFPAHTAVSALDPRLEVSEDSVDPREQRRRSVRRPLGAVGVATRRTPACAWSPDRRPRTSRARARASHGITVPAVTETWWRHALHCSSVSRATGYAFACWHRGHRYPFGQRDSMRYRWHASSVEKRTWNSARVFGKSGRGTRFSSHATTYRAMLSQPDR